MNKLYLWLIAGVVLIFIGGTLISLSNYVTQTAYAINNCYTLYPSTYNATTGMYTYSQAYYTCENNSQLAVDNAQLYTSLLEIPGWIITLAGALSFVLSLALLIIGTYKDRNKGRK